MDEKIFSSALTQEDDGSKAIEELASKVNKELNGRTCDLAILFISESYRDYQPEDLLQNFRQLVQPTLLIACNSSGVIGEKNEVEMQPAMSAMAMHLPGVSFRPFTLSGLELNSIREGTDLIKALDIYPTDQPNFICLADPLSCDVNKLLQLFNDGYQKCPVIGGLASGVVAGVENWLSLDGDIYTDGAVGIALVGDIHFDIIVSQGCRPIGEPYTITKADENIVYELAGKSAVKALNEVLMQLRVEDQILAQHSLFVGIVRDEQRVNFKRGDFLVRNILGADVKRGALAIGEVLEAGQTLQFQLRDARTSDEELKYLLKKIRHFQRHANHEGALLVSCCGRGRGLYGEPNHDVRTIQSMRGPIPLAGFFANGEFGPIDNKNYIHGYTSSLAILH